MGSVFLAQRINQIIGGAVIAPWQVQDLSADWLEAILSIELVGEYRKSRTEIESIFDQWRATHKGYHA